MKNLITIIFCITVYSVSAQTLTQANSAFNIGDHFISTNCDTVGITKGPAGTGITWDFSTLSPIGTSNIIVVDPITTPYSASYPTANVATKTNDTIYTYYNSSVDSLSYFGMSNPSYSVIQQIPRKELDFPLSISSSFSYSALGWIGVGYHRKTNTTAIVDASGTLITPAGTYPNTLRIKYDMVTIDTIYFLGNPAGTMIQNGTYYKWYDSNHNYELLTIGSSTFQTSTTKFVEYYQDAPATSILKPSSKSTSIYPNPANDIINFDVTSSDINKIEILDIQGRLVKDFNNINSQSIDISDLNRGLYFINIYTYNEIIAKEFIKK